MRSCWKKWIFEGTTSLFYFYDISLFSYIFLNLFFLTLFFSFFYDIKSFFFNKISEMNEKQNTLKLRKNESNNTIKAMG